MMFNLARSSFAARSARAFSSSSRTSYDVAKLILVGRLARAPELRVTQKDKEYVAYTVVTNNYPPPPRDQETGEYPKGTSTFHRVISFSQSANSFLTRIKKGTPVYVEANYEVREPNPAADAGSYEAVRQVFLKHENLRVLGPAPSKEGEEDTS